MRSQPDDPTWRAMSAGTMKMPEPIIDPATIIVESSRPSSRTNPWSPLSARSGTVCAALLLRGASSSPGKGGAPATAKGRDRLVRERAIAYTGLGGRRRSATVTTRGSRSSCAAPGSTSGTNNARTVS